MKIAVTSTDRGVDSPVDQRFGRAAYFVIVDTDSMHAESFENPAVTSPGGAGITAAKFVIDHGAEAVLTGNCGPNAERTLGAGGIKLYTGVSGSVSETVEAFKAGGLKEANGPNVDAHFGIQN